MNDTPTERKPVRPVARPAAAAQPQESAQPRPEALPDHPVARSDNSPFQDRPHREPPEEAAARVAAGMALDLDDDGDQYEGDVAAASEATAPAAPDDSAGPALRGHVRVPMGSRVQKLALPPRAGFHRHWFNDTPGRIEDTYRAGYTHIKDSQGRNMTRIVGTREMGGGQQGFAMEIRLEWHLEYQAIKQQRLDEEDRVIQRGAHKVEPGDNRYVPKSTPIRIRSVSGGGAR